MTPKTIQIKIANKKKEARLLPVIGSLSQRPFQGSPLILVSHFLVRWDNA